jgi:hypothetical protein
MNLTAGTPVKVVPPGATQKAARPAAGR